MGLTPKTSRSHPRGGRSMALDIMIWLAFSLVTVHVIGGLWAHYMLKQRFMQQLEQDASSTASTLATALESSIWNLDPDRIPTHRDATFHRDQVRCDAFVGAMSSL